MPEVTRTPAAQRDLDEILEWLVERDEATADRFAAALEARCSLLASQPNTGRRRDDLLPGLRSVVVEWYVVFFEPTPDAVIVHRIIHGSRNITPDSFADE